TDTATTEIYTLSLHDALPILSDKGTPSADWHWACPAQLELVSTSRGGVRCLTGVRQRHTFSGLALGLNPSAGAREHLQSVCEVFDRCPTKAHLQRTGTGFEPLSWSSLAPPEGVFGRRSEVRRSTLSTLDS